MDDRAMMALLLSTAAGMATMVGAGAAVLFRRPPAWMMALSLGLAAGVMTGVSLSELLPEGISVLLIAMPGAAGIFAAGAAAAAGALFAALLELMMPQEQGRSGYRRLGLLSMIVLLVHNLPEGVAVFLSGNSDLHAGLVLWCRHRPAQYPGGDFGGDAADRRGRRTGRGAADGGGIGVCRTGGGAAGLALSCGAARRVGPCTDLLRRRGLDDGSFLRRAASRRLAYRRRGPAFCGVLLGAAVMILAGRIGS